MLEGSEFELLVTLAGLAQMKLDPIQIQIQANQMCWKLKILFQSIVKFSFQLFQLCGLSFLQFCFNCTAPESLSSLYLVMEFVQHFSTSEMEVLKVTSKKNMKNNNKLKFNP